MDPDVLLQAPDGRPLSRQEIAAAAHVLALACRSGEELEHIDHELANEMAPERRLELRQEADRIVTSLDRTLAEVPIKSALVELLTPVWMPPVNAAGVLRCDSRRCRT